MDFDPHLNVIVGVNGAGKTTLLEAIVKTMALITQGFVAVGNPEEFSALNFSGLDINYDEDNIRIDLNADLLPYKGLFRDTDSVTDWENVRIGALGNVIKTGLGIISKFGSSLSSNVSLVYTSEGGWDSRISDSEYQETIPIFSFFPANRGGEQFTDIKSNSSATLYQLKQLEAWENIIQDNFSVSNFLKWFYDHENIELRVRKQEGEWGIEIAVLLGVREAVSRAFSVLMNGEFVIESVTRTQRRTNAVTPSINVVNSVSGEKKFFEHLSHGEKAIVTLVSIIAYKLAIAKGENTWNTIKVLDSPGVVLIDEIELHLHPKWQRQIIPLLRKVFPNIQFFITTHSPQVVASVNSQNLILCDNFHLKKVGFKSLGADSNSILKYIFETSDRPGEIVSLIQDFDNLMDQEAPSGKLEEKRNEIAALLAKDPGTDMSSLLSELDTLIIAHKYDMNEVD